MYKIDGYDVELTRGDSLTLRVVLKGLDLPDGTNAIFTMKRRPKDTDILIQKQFDASDNQVIIQLYASETDLDPRTYYWDLRLQVPLNDGGYKVYTPMEYAAFTIVDAIGLDFGTDGDPGDNPDVPVIRVLIQEARSVIAKITGMTFSAETGSHSAVTPSVTEDGGLHLHLTLEQGPPGTSLRILGTYPTLEDLSAAVPSPEIGDIYNVGTEDPYTSYVWDPSLTWVSQGNLLQGPKGDPFVYEDFTEEQLAALKGADGLTVSVNGVEHVDGNIAVTGSKIPVSAEDETTVADALANRVNKEDGKGLSTNDYTNEEKQSLAAVVAQSNAIYASMSIITSHAVTLLSTGWTVSAEQTVSVEGVLSNMDRIHIFYEPASEQYETFKDAQIRGTAQGEGTITFTAESVPDEDINLTVLVIDLGVTEE